MRHTPRIRLRGALSLLLLAAAAAAAAQVRVLGENVQLGCTQPDSLSLSCDYRLLDPAPLVGVSASVEGVELAQPSHRSFDAPPDPIAVLFLVDTSDPAREPVMARNVRDIRSLVSAAAPQHRFGLAAFDTNLRVEAPLGSSPREVEEAARGLHATGETTELYRNALEAVHLLAAYPAERRALVLLSDGLAEDRAYFHEDVIAAAREAGVVIFGLGYARSVSLSVALQTLRRLAEETGGMYLRADARPELPSQFVERAYAALDNGGHLELDLAAAEQAGLGGERNVQITWMTGQGSARARVPVRLPVPPPPAPQPVIVEKPVPVEAPAAPSPAPATTAATRAPPAAASGDDRLVWYSAASAAAALLALLLVAVALRRRRPAEPAAAAPEGRPLAFLERADGTRHAVSSAAFRMGRHSDNELALDDPSISRHHAEIHRRRDGSFTITDLDSMNGVYVNGQQVNTATLSEGDHIELGDIGLRFTVRTAEELPGEETVMLKTVTPPPLREAQHKGTG